MLPVANDALSLLDSGTTPKKPRMRSIEKAEERIERADEKA